MADLTYLDLSRVTAYRVTAPLISRSRSGYGNRVPTSMMLQLDGKRWYRVYVVCWSNSGTAYVRTSDGMRWLADGWDYDVTRTVKRLDVIKVGSSVHVSKGNRSLVVAVGARGVVLEQRDDLQHVHGCAAFLVRLESGAEALFFHDELAAH